MIASRYIYRKKYTGMFKVSAAQAYEVKWIPIPVRVPGKAMLTIRTDMGKWGIQ